MFPFTYSPVAQFRLVHVEPPAVDEVPPPHEVQEVIVPPLEKVFAGH